MWGLQRKNCLFLGILLVVLCFNLLFISLTITSNKGLYSFDTARALFVVKRQSRLLNALKLESDNKQMKNNLPADLLSQKAFSLPKNDYSQLLNLTNFNFTLINNHGCSYHRDAENPLLLILVVTSPSNHNRRKVVRETWGNVTSDVKLVFLMAAGDNEIQKAIDEENFKHRDIVQANFKDAYRNLTYKTVMSLKYVVYHCPFSKYVLKIDDDAMVNMPLLIHFLKHQLSPRYANNLLLCDLLYYKSPYRRPGHKWHVSEEEFPGEYYPTYCPGWVSMFTPDTAFRLYREAQKTKFFWLEDVFLYGIVAEKVLNTSNIKRLDLTELTTTWYYPDYLLNGKYGNPTFLFGGPDFEDEFITDFWKYVNEKNNLMLKKIDKLWTFIVNQTSINQTKIHYEIYDEFNYGSYR